MCQHYPEHLLFIISQNWKNTLGTFINDVPRFLAIFDLPTYSDVSIKNIDILPNRQYIANTADSAQEQYS